MEIILLAAAFYFVTQFKGDSNTMKPKIPISNESWKLLKAFAEKHGFFVTATNGGKHNVGSKHYLGRAIDVRTNGVSDAKINQFILDAKAEGIKVLDERVRPAGQKVWGGAHLHLEV